jgi:hypothetical protein
MKTQDALGRRPRETPHSTGKVVSPQERDMLWFRKLHEHGPLSSRYLHAFSVHLARNEKRAQDRLTDLFHESCTPHGGSYLIRPWQQFETLDARYQDLVYDLAPAGEAALREHGFWHDRGAAAHGPWRHRAMVAAVTASIELATHHDPALTYIPQHAILKRAGATLRCPVPFTNPNTRKPLKSDLIPDALFGLQYGTGTSQTFRFFVVEADRGTEPTRASGLSRKSHLRHFLQYALYINGGRYKDHLRLTAPLLVLNVFTNEVVASNAMRLASEVSPGGMSYQLFACVPQFGRHFKPAQVMNGLLHEPWRRAGFQPLLIARA